MWKGEREQHAISTRAASLQGLQLLNSMFLQANLFAAVAHRDLATATQLTQFKGNASGRGRVCRLGSDYLAAAQNSKDAIHFWAWHKVRALCRLLFSKAAVLRRTSVCSSTTKRGSCTLYNCV
jgi:hypothetical protein